MPEVVHHPETPDDAAASSTAMMPQPGDKQVEEVEEAMLPLPLDQGYAWVVMLASMCNNFIIDGIANTYCEMLVDFIDYFDDAPKSSLSLIGSLLCGVYLMSGPVAGGLVNKFGCRVTCVLGSVISCLAFLFSSFARSVTALTLLYGVMGGIGLGLMYLPSIVIVNFYFRKRRSLAVGLAVCGTGIGTMVMGPVVRLLLEHYGWQNCLMILAGFTLNGAVFGCLMRPIDVTEKPPEADGVDDVAMKPIATDPAEASSAAGDSSLVQKYIKNVAQAAVTTKGNAEAVEEAEADEARLRSNSDTGGIRFKRNKVKQPSKSRVVAGAAAGGGNLMESTPDIVKEIRVRPRGQTSVAADYAAGGGGGAGRLISRSRLQEVRRPLNQKDIFLSSSIFDLAQHDPRMKQSLKDVSQANLFLSMTRMPQLDLESVIARSADGSHKAAGVLDTLRASKPFRYALSMMTNFSLLKELSYLIIFAANLVGMIAFYIPGFFISDFAKETGVPRTLTPTLISAYGAANTLARVVFGFLAGQRHFSPLAINNITILITGVSVALLVACRSYVSMVTVFSLFGFFSGPYISLTSVILCQLIGLENVTSGFGLLVLARGLSSCCGPPIGGCLYTEATGYLVPFLVSGALFVLCGLMHSLLHLPRFRRREAENAEDIVRSLQSLASSRVQC